MKKIFISKEAKELFKKIREQYKLSDKPAISYKWQQEDKKKNKKIVLWDEI